MPGKEEDRWVRNVVQRDSEKFTLFASKEFLFFILPLAKSPRLCHICSPAATGVLGLSVAKHCYASYNI